MRLLIARHAETVYNAAARMQGQMGHTPLTRTGIAQAEAMGAALAALIDPAAPLDLWSSPSGRTLQTAGIVAEHLGRDYFDIRTDPRLLEIDVGAWQGRLYSDIVAEQGEILDRQRRLFTVTAPGGETYVAIAARLEAWLDALDPHRDILLISHGQTLRVLRGLLAGGEPFRETVVAADAPQGTIFMIEGGRQHIVHEGQGHRPTAA